MKGFLTACALCLFLCGCVSDSGSAPEATLTVGDARIAYTPPPGLVLAQGKLYRNPVDYGATIGMRDTLLALYLTEEATRNSTPDSPRTDPRGSLAIAAVSGREKERQTLEFFARARQAIEKEVGGRTQDKPWNVIFSLGLPTEKEVWPAIRPGNDLHASGRTIHLGVVESGPTSISWMTAEDALHDFPPAGTHLRLITHESLLLAQGKLLSIRQTYAMDPAGNIRGQLAAIWDQSQRRLMALNIRQGEADTLFSAAKNRLREAFSFLFLPEPRHSRAP